MRAIQLFPLVTKRNIIMAMIVKNSGLREMESEFLKKLPSTISDGLRQ